MFAPPKKLKKHIPQRYTDYKIRNQFIFCITKYYQRVLHAHVTITKYCGNCTLLSITPQTM